MVDEYKNIGEILSRKRAELNKELEQISEEIKVSLEYLKAIERGDFKALPSVIYYKLFVRAYAQELGLDGNQLLEEHEIEDHSTEKPELDGNGKQGEVKKRRRPESETPLLKIGIFLAIIVIIAFAIIIIFVPRSNQEIETGDSDQADEVIETLPDSQSILAEDTTPVQDTTPVVELPMKLDVYIPGDSSWLVVAADGDTVLGNTLYTGARRSYTADYRFLITMGNPYSVELRINDTLLRDISNGGKVVKGFEINRLNKEDLFYNPEDSLAQ
jgi:cytoskeletal protein RodZ